MLKVFVDLYEQGLIYRDKRLVNWDPKFQTAISDLEVAAGRGEGASSGTSATRSRASPDRFITVATTRPETMLGDTGVAVHPDDERYSGLVGKTPILPLVGRRIPIVADEYSDPEKGTGAVKITPAHDFNDFEVGRRHGLPLDQHPRRRGAARSSTATRPSSTACRVARVSTRCSPSTGSTALEARKRIVAMLEERGLARRRSSRITTPCRMATARAWSIEP